MGKKTNDDNSKNWISYIGLAILVFCYLGAIWNVFQVKKNEFSGIRVIRIAHWQLELGVVDALDEMARDYEEYYKKTHNGEIIKIEQIPVPGKAYGQWTLTQLIGRTAPDLIEMGKFDKSYIGRFFTPLTDEISKPNHFNENNPKFKDTPWKDTFTDSLENCYLPDLMDYYSVGFSQFTIRLFYNKTLFKEILGTDVPPKDLAQLFEYCENIKQYRDTRNREINAYNRNHAGADKSPFVLDPISSSLFQVEFMRPIYAATLSADSYLKLDENNDGFSSKDEILAGLINGKFTLENKKYRAGMELIRNLSKYFNPGFMSVGREDAGFSFVQGKSTMITSGSWDASSYIKQVEDQPFGDIITSIDNVKVSTVKDVEKELMKHLSSKNLAVEIIREGAKRTIYLNPINGKNIWEAFGIKLKSVAYNDKIVAVVNDINELSPAYLGGMKKRRIFEIGFLNFPLPTKEDPIYGKLFVGSVAENSKTGFRFGLVKFSKNKEIAIDFLKFCTTPKNNGKLNKIAQWVPAVHGAKIVDFLKAFNPNFDGYWGALTFHVGNRSEMVENQIFWMYVSGDISYDEYLKRLYMELPAAVAADAKKLIRRVNEKLADKHLMRSICLANVMFAKTEKELKKAKKRLASAWDTVLYTEKNEPEMRKIMKPFYQKLANPNKFAKKVYKHFEIIKE